MRLPAGVLQVDHVNVHALVRAALAGRQTHFTEIVFDKPPAEPEPLRAARATVEFTSCDDERVLLDVVTVGVPDAARAGLSSPGTHARHGVLPLMVRGESALASDRTRVVIDGRSYPIPEKLRVPGFVAHEGYFTRSHHMAIVRAGEIPYEMRRVPRRIEVGAEWSLQTADGERCYRIAAVDADGAIRAHRTTNVAESIVFALIDGAIDLRALRVSDERDPSKFAEIAFDGEDRFAIGVDGVPAWVAGTVDRHANGFTLRPTTPEWAIDRPVRTTFARRQALHIVTTTIGAS